ncbi:hypothetical protein, partial [Stenotrophomonas maltophilia]|uniref:hypothetical protein n=1 Tax=Stenotrophomonas maltophilia TaxID=40324 RepID=UPI0019539944
VPQGFLAGLCSSCRRDFSAFGLAIAVGLDSMAPTLFDRNETGTNDMGAAPETVRALRSKLAALERPADLGACDLFAFGLPGVDG